MGKLNAEAMKTRVNDLIETGKAKGILTYSEIMETLGDAEIVAEQFDKILEALSAIGIEVVKDANADDAEPEPDIINMTAEEEIDISVLFGISFSEKRVVVLKITRFYYLKIVVEKRAAGAEIGRFLFYREALSAV